MFGSGRVAIPGAIEWSGKSGSGLETLLDVRKARLDVQEWLGGPLVCPVVVGRPSRMSGSGRVVLPYVR